MTDKSPFSKASVRRKLLHFAVGKAGSAVVGFALLLVLVRLLPVPEYGVYIALLALFEVGQLSSNAGAYAGAHRFVPQLLARQQGRSLRSLVWILAAYRAFTLLLCCLLIWCFLEPVSGYLGLASYTGILSLYLVVLFSEGLARYIDLLFDALFEQGRVQVAVLSRNLIRLLGATLLLLSGSDATTLADWVMVEIAGSSFGVLMSLVMLRSLLERQVKESPGTDGSLTWAPMVRYSAINYLSQLGYLFQSVDAVRLVVTKTVGLAIGGAFGFTSALGAMIRRYLPSFLLIGMIRTLLVARHEQGYSTQQLGKTGDLVIRLNLFLILPLLVVASIAGELLLNVLSAGKFANATPLLLLFLFLLVLQTYRSVLEMLGNAVGSQRAPVLASIASVIVLGFCLLGTPTWGLVAIGFGMVFSELTFTIVMILGLRSSNLSYRPDVSAFGRLIALSIIALALGWSFNYYFVNQLNLPPTIELAFLVFFILAVFYGVGIFIKPFSRAESQMINDVLPKKVFLW